MKTRLEQILGWVDRLLLLTVAGLMFTFHRDMKHLAEVFQRPSAAATAAVEASATAEAPAHSPSDAPPAPPEYVMTASRHTISISPGGVTESRVSRVARSLASDIGWEGAPVSQAADMRERNGLYDIAVALSHHIDERSVQVTTDGNVLSLSAAALGNPHAVFVKRFLIPCNPAQVGPVETSVSNGVVRVRIHPAE